MPVSFVKRRTLSSGRVDYRAVWSEGEKRKSKSFASQKAAKEHARVMAERARHGFADPGKMTVAGFFDLWLEGIEARGELSEITTRNYRAGLSKFRPLIGNRKLALLTASDIEAALIALLRGEGCRKPLSPVWVRTLRTTLRTCLAAARKRKLIVSNPVDDTERVAGKQRRKVRPFTLDEARAIFAAADQIDAADSLFLGIDCAVRLLMIAGMRRSELGGLRWRDLTDNIISITATVVPGKLGEGVLREDTTKTEGSARRITLKADVVERLRLHRIEQMKAMLMWPGYRKLDLIFAEPDGKPLRPARITDHLRKLMHAAGITGRQPTHAWRHSSATELLALGVDVATVGQRLGHSSPRTTLAIYCHSSEARDAAAATALAAMLG